MSYWGKLRQLAAYVEKKTGYTVVFGHDYYNQNIKLYCDEMSVGWLKEYDGIKNGDELFDLFCELTDQFISTVSVRGE